jgi:hypothetical protein
MKSYVQIASPPCFSFGLKDGNAINNISRAFKANLTSKTKDMDSSKASAVSPKFRKQRTSMAKSVSGSERKYFVQLPRPW